MNYTEEKQSSIFFISKAELLAYILCINANLRNIATNAAARTNQSIREIHIVYYAITRLILHCYYFSNSILLME